MTLRKSSFNKETDIQTWNCSNSTFSTGTGLGRRQPNAAIEARETIDSGTNHSGVSLEI